MVLFKKINGGRGLMERFFEMLEFYLLSLNQNIVGSHRESSTRRCACRASSFQRDASGATGTTPRDCCELETDSTKGNKHSKIRDRRHLKDMTSKTVHACVFDQKDFKNWGSRLILRKFRMATGFIMIRK